MVVVGIVIAYRFLRVPENRARVSAWIAEQAERPALRPLARVLAPVYRHVVAPIARFLREPARFFWNRVTPGMLGLEFTTLLAVAAVGELRVLRAGGLRRQPRCPPRIDTDTLRYANDLRSDMLTDVAKAVTVLGRF